MKAVKYPGIRVVMNGNTLVSYETEARLADAGIFFPITPSTEMGELFQLSYAQGRLNVFGRSTLAVETEGEHSAQGGAIAYAVTGKRVVNFTSGQGVVYGIEQYYHAPGKLATMVLEVASRALTKHALNVHCGHDDIYAALDTGWIILFGKDAQQAADQALILRKVTEMALTPGINVQDGFLTSHLERSFLKHESELIREFLGAPEDIIDCPTPAQVELFGPKRRRVPELIDLRNPILLGPVQNQEHYMNGVIARRNGFYEPILGFLEDAYKEFGQLTGRHYGLLSEYKCEDAETVFVTLGSAAENIEAAVDHLRATRGASVGSIHVNVLRPFPEVAIAKALAGRKNAIVLERTDEPLATDNPLARDIRAALGKALERHGKQYEHAKPSIAPDQMPHLFRGSYGLGSRDFRPEAILGAYEYAIGEGRRKDGRTAAQGYNYFTLGIDHPYEVHSAEKPSLLPEQAIAVRLHSIGGWGMITTGKNLGAIIGALAQDIAERNDDRDAEGNLIERLHISANPKYGSEKKGAPTAYFMVVAPERVRVNCDLHHVDVVLCCDPKAFTHSNPLEGINEGGAFVWESEETPEMAWTRIPPEYRQEIIDKKIRLYILPGFGIARESTDRPELQLRMQGNSFLGGFFHVSPFLKDNAIDVDRFHSVVRAQYNEKFGRFGDAVVESNMNVMIQGFERVQEVPYGELEAPDRSAMQGKRLLPVIDTTKSLPVLGSIPKPAAQPERPPVARTSYFDAEYRSGLGYHQPASPLAAVGTIAAATGATASKFVARRETPIYIAENCTQCMKCVAACPDTALVTTAQEIDTVLTTAAKHYVTDSDQRALVLRAMPAVEKAVRESMSATVKAKGRTPFSELADAALKDVEGLTEASRKQIVDVLELTPMAYAKTNAIFSIMEKKNPGEGGLFSIVVSDLCKGCAECVTECGEHEALRMQEDSEELNARVAGAAAFLNLLPETQDRYLGLYSNSDPRSSKMAALRNHMMIRSNYNALCSGDGACAGCGEKSVLHAVASLTEAYVRPLYHAKAARLREKAERIAADGVTKLQALAARDKSEHELYRQAVAHIVMGLGGENDADTKARMAAHGTISDQNLVDALVAVLRQDAFNHAELQAVDGMLDNGMSVMVMGASTGCNTVYGSTPPNNPHPYPWMNSLFQDGPTITWMFGENFLLDHSRRSVLPERLVDALLDRSAAVMTQNDYFELTHFTDAYLTDEEIREMPKAWCIGGDGALGDIGFQNLSKVILQNRPNVQVLMLDTQVYSNTGGQNSDSSLMTGGFDMNQIGAATQGKLTEKKSVAEILTAGHGSPFVAQVSMADATRLYSAILDGIDYRGTAFFQCFTTCQPEHGVGNDMAAVQAARVRDARCLPEFVFDPQQGETYAESIDLKGNRNRNRDWLEVKAKSGDRYNFTVAHWAATEARFRRHIVKAKPDAIEGMLRLEDILACLTQRDVVKRHHLREGHRAYIPDFGVYTMVENEKGEMQPMTMSRQMVLLCVERRKAWRMLQSRAGQQNDDYIAQRSVLAKVDAGKLSVEELRSRGAELVEEERRAAE